MFSKLKLLALSMALFAYGALADINIAVIDINQIFKESSVSSVLTDKMKKQQQDLKAVFSEQKSNLEEEYKSLAAQKGIISESAFAQKISDLNTKATSLEGEANAKASALEKDYLQKLDKVSAKLKVIIKNYSKKQSVDLVLQSSQVAYKNDNVLDITSDIMTTLNKEMPTLN